MNFEQLWAGWRATYLETAIHGLDHPVECVFCSLIALEDDPKAYILWRGTFAVAILNAYPYSSGHLMIMPKRHVGEMEELDPDEGMDLLRGATNAVRALKSAYSPEGINVGVNIGSAAGAGIPGHFHIHVLPRWRGDTNFMTTVAGMRVIPESLDVTWEKLSKAWPIS